MDDYDNWKLMAPYDVNSDNLERFEETIKVTGVVDDESNFHAKQWDLFIDEFRELCEKYNFKTDL